MYKLWVTADLTYIPLDLPFRSNYTQLTLKLIYEIN